MSSAEERSLYKNNAHLPVVPKTISTVGELEQKLLCAFPVKDACDWDYTGLFVGDPAAPVTGVAVALDPTISAMKQALDAGANVLVTHHPVYLDAPDCFLPSSIQGNKPGALVHFALSHGLNCMAFHTACDASVKGLRILPSMLRLRDEEVLDPLPHDPSKGFGMICSVEEGSLTLEHLAARCVSVFESFPRVWGNPQKDISRVATCGGSAGSVLDLCRERGIECLICGELKYHDALDALQDGLSIIELGHDVSELPLCALLAAEVIAAGVDESRITMIDQRNNWYIPESIRR